MAWSVVKQFSWSTKPEISTRPLVAMYVRHKNPVYPKININDNRSNKSLLAFSEMKSVYIKVLNIN